MQPYPISRREMLQRLGTGLGVIGLAGLLQDNGLLAAERKAGNPLAPKQPHFAPKAKRIIHLFMNGGPSQVDTFDPKPGLDKYHGKKAAGQHQGRAQQHQLDAVAVQVQQVRQIGIEVSEMYPRVARVHRRYLRHPLDAHQHAQP